MNLTTRITDYLNTQGLRQDAAEVRAAAQILGTIAEHTDADLPRDVLWCAQARPDFARVHRERFDLGVYLPETPHNHQLLSGLYAAADTLFAQYPCRHLSLFRLQHRQLLRLLSCGSIGEGLLPADEADWQVHLAVRCAISAWFAHADNCAKWAAAGDLIGVRHQQPLQQWALPICQEDGALLGVLYGESALEQVFDDTMQAWWVGFSIVLANLLNKLECFPDNAICP